MESNRRISTIAIHSRKRSPMLVLILALMLILLPLAHIQAAAGDLDPTFGNGGKVITAFGGDQLADLRDIALQSDGKVVAGGAIAGASPTYDFALARYLGNGNLDPTFGSGGRVTTDWGTDELIMGIAIQPDGKIIAAGFVGLRFGVARYNPNGTLDTSFGNQGLTITSFSGGNDFPTRVAVRPDGKIVVVGRGQNDFAVICYNPDGTLDPSFGTGGKVHLDILGDDIAYAVVLQGDNILVGGFCSAFGQFSRYGLIRLDKHGNLDTTFGLNGKALTAPLNAPQVALALALQPDGKILQSGWAAKPGGGNTYMLTVRYDANGILDPTFGSSGSATTELGGQGTIAAALVVQKNGKIVLGGTWIGEIAQDCAVVRYNPNGTPDQTFGSGGAVITDLGSSLDAGLGLALQSDGKIILGGTTGGTFAIARYDGDSVFDLCVQDESNDNLLQLNTTTGEYLFTNCAGLSVGGTGILTKRGSLIMLQHNAADRRVLATVDTSTKRATASIQLLSQGRLFSITDRNIANNTCVCK